MPAKPLMVSSNKSDAEAEADETIDVFDTLVRRRDELRAEIDRLRVDEGAYQSMLAVLDEVYPDSVYANIGILRELVAQRKAALDEIERLKNVEIVSLEAEVVAHVDEIERLRAAIRLALQYMTAGGHEYRATQADGQAAVDTLLGVVR